MLGALTGHRLQVPFPHYQVGLAAHLDLELVFCAEQHPVTHLNYADVMSDTKNFSPRQPLGHVGRRRDNDAAATSTLTVFAQEPHHYPVVQHLDLELAVGHGERLRAARVAAHLAPLQLPRASMSVTSTGIDEHGHPGKWKAP